MLSKTCLALVAVTLIGGPTLASAQTPQDRAAHHPDAAAAAGAPAGPAGMAAMMPMMQMMPMMRGMMGVDHVEGRIAYDKAELAITDAQLPQWNAVAAVQRANAKVMQDAMAKMAQDGMPNTMPARGDMMVLMMSERLDGMKKLMAAHNALYAVLSPDQRKIADEMMGGPMSAM